jgi:hypothetical protein
MSEGKFTPGPWRASEMKMDKASWAALRGKSIDVVLRGSDVIAAVWCGDDRDGDESANARLIAAAPDMYKALEAAMASGMVPKSSVSDGGACRHSAQVRAADMIRAALAKAKGE